MGNLLQIMDLLINPDDLRLAPKEPQERTSSKDWIHLEVNKIKYHTPILDKEIIQGKVILAKANNQEAFEVKGITVQEI